MGGGSQGLPPAPAQTSRAQRGREPPLRARERRLSPGYGMAAVKPQAAELLRTGEGTGGESSCSGEHRPGGASPSVRVRERSSVSDTELALAAGARRFSYKPAGTSPPFVLEDFSREGRGEPPGAEP